MARQIVEGLPGRGLRKMKRTSGRAAVVPLAVILCITPRDTASQIEKQDALVEAQRLRDARDFAAAAKLLRAQIAQRPDDGEAARLLAQTLYWLKDIAGAHAVYDTALLRHPEDTTLRLQYARMLAETGERARSRELLTPLLSISATRGEAEALLGMLAYWEDDLTTARRLFVSSLQADPNQEEVKSLLGELLARTAPWMRVSSGVWRDDQPLDQLALRLEAGWFPTPLTELTARVQPMRYWIDNSARTVGVSEVTATHYAPLARLETELAGGGVRRSNGGDAWDWTGRAVLGLRLPEHVTLQARVERTPYLFTTSSLDTPVMVQSVQGLLHWDDARGWLGEAAYQQQHYPDGNTIRLEYGWLLVPLVREGGLDLNAGHARLAQRRGVEVQVGYALAASNANESRFVLAQPNQPYPPSDPRFSTAGRYAPYYTPSHLITHSAIAAFTLRLAIGATFHLDGSYAIRATDDAPFFAVSGGQVALSTYPRRFSPWKVHTSLTIPVRNGLTVEPIAEIGRTVFYSWATGGLQITYNFKAAKANGQ